ncbi:MAG: DUF6495 family protein [Bacteroidota bacterium]
MKYRRLKKDELAELENEFVRFLASQSITGPDWEKMKTERQEQAEGLLDIFSDLVYDKILKDIEYLELKTKADLKTFHCGPDKIIMRGIMVEGHSNIDFTKNHSPEQMIGQMKMSQAELKLYRAEKRYSKAREQELFQMLETGCLISKGELFKILADMDQA